jgi:hypothetical protein
MRKYGRTLHVGRLHLAIMGGQVFIDWRLDIDWYATGNET